MIAVPRSLAPLGGLALLAATAAGCGATSRASSPPAPQTTGAPVQLAAPARAHARLRLEADEDGGLYFKTRRLTAKAGTVTISMENPGSSGKPHGIAIEGHGVDRDGKVVAPGGTSRVTVRLEPGRYSFYCPIPAHEAAGMKGTLIVH